MVDLSLGVFDRSTMPMSSGKMPAPVVLSPVMRTADVASAFFLSFSREMRNKGYQEELHCRCGLAYAASRKLMNARRHPADINTRCLEVSVSQHRIKSVLTNVIDGQSLGRERHPYVRIWLRWQIAAVALQRKTSQIRFSANEDVDGCVVSHDMPQAATAAPDCTVSSVVTKSVLRT